LLQHSAKLSHHCSSPYVVEKRVGPILYHLKLLPVLQRLYSVFNVIKLTTIPKNPISDRHPCPLLDPVIIDRKEE